MQTNKKKPIKTYRKRNRRHRRTHRTRRRVGGVRNLSPLTIQNNNNSNANTLRTLQTQYISEHSEFDTPEIHAVGIQSFLQTATRLQILGKGSQATSYRIRHGESEYILRIVYAANVSQLQNEIQIYKQLSSYNKPFLSKLLYAEIPAQQYGMFESYFLFPYEPGYTLEQRIASKEPMTISEIEHLTRHLLQALDFIHSLGIIHRDLKPSNIYIPSRSNIPQLFDFETACQIQNEGCLSDQFVGSPEYAHPNLYEAFHVKSEPIVRYTQYYDTYEVGRILQRDLAPLVPTEENRKAVLRYAQTILQKSRI